MLWFFHSRVSPDLGTERGTKQPEIFFHSPNMKATFNQTLLAYQKASYPVSLSIRYSPEHTTMPDVCLNRNFRTNSIAPQTRSYLCDIWYISGFRALKLWEMGMILRKMNLQGESDHRIHPEVESITNIDYRSISSLQYRWHFQDTAEWQPNWNASKLLLRLFPPGRRSGSHGWRHAGVNHVAAIWSRPDCLPFSLWLWQPHSKSKKPFDQDQCSSP